MRTLDMWLISAQTRMIKAKESVKEFVTSEKGVSEIVAIIIVLLIVVLLVGFFWKELQTWLDEMMDKIFTTKFNSDGLSTPQGEGPM